MRALYNNVIVDSTLTHASEDTDYPAENIFHPHLSTQYHTTGDSDEWVKITQGGTNIKVGYVCIMNHNLTSGATVKLQGHTSDSWASPSVSYDLTITDNIILQIAAVEYDWWRITFADASNPDGHLEIGYIFLGEHLQIPGMRIDQTIDDKTDTIFDISGGRTLYADQRTDYNEFAINFPYVTTAQRDLIRAMFSEVGTHTPIIILIWADDLTLQDAIYCHFSETITWKHKEGASMIWETAFKMRQVF